MLARSLEVQRRLRIGDDDGLIGARSCGKPAGVTALRHELLQCGRLCLRAGNECPRENARRQIGVDHEDDVDRSAFLRNRLVVRCRIANTPAVGLHASRDNGRDRELLIAA